MNRRGFIGRLLAATVVALAVELPFLAPPAPVVNGVDLGVKLAEIFDRVKLFEPVERERRGRMWDDLASEQPWRRKNGPKYRIVGRH